MDTAIADVAICTIARLVAIEFGVSLPDLMGPSRVARLKVPRQIAHYLSRRVGWTYPQIGQALHRDHTTVLHSARVVEARMAADARWRERIEALAVQCERLEA